MILGAAAEILEAARTDGANEFQIFWRIILPMVSLPISVLAVTLIVNVVKLAAETVRTIENMTWLGEASIAATVESVLLPLRPDPDVEREQPPFGLGTGDLANTVYDRERRLVLQQARSRDGSSAFCCSRDCRHRHGSLTL